MVVAGGGLTVLSLSDSSDGALGRPLVAVVVGGVRRIVLSSTSESSLSVSDNSCFGVLLG